MKNIFTRFLLISSFQLLTVSLNVSLAQPPIPPRNGQGGNQGGNQGPTAPIDGGLGISLAMVAGYGAYKLLKAMQKKQAVR